MLPFELIATGKVSKAPGTSKAVMVPSLFLTKPCGNSCPLELAIQVPVTSPAALIATGWVATAPGTSNTVHVGYEKADPAINVSRITYALSREIYMQVVMSAELHHVTLSMSTANRNTLQLT